AVRILGFEKRIKFYQASTSELFGDALPPQNELTPFKPKSPYGSAKLYAYWATINYRESYGMHASNGILFNHESSLRGETCVTRKITRGIAAIKLGVQKKIYVGNLNAKRDWGHAKDYVKGMWLMLQQDRPDDYVLATGESHTVREFVELAFNEIGCLIEWKGSGLKEKGINKKTRKTIIEVDSRYFRPNEVEHLCGDPTKANEQLGWSHKTSFTKLIKEMVKSDLSKVKKETSDHKSYE
ncbi:MAG: GDP-mannose 4,6-dehydratase, partial [Pseudomonadota bacterium]|nr:GDP-mannose 4,6-dehydratase [Pseudomonadota bacterium]